MKNFKIAQYFCIAAFLIVCLSSSSPFAASLEEFYKGKIFRIVVGSAPGGGYDTHARILARHISKHIPGNPQVVVQNMPGAGSIIAANYLYKIAPKNGTVIGTVQRPIPNMQLLGQKGVQFDAAKFNWLGSINKDVGVTVTWHTSPVKTIQDAMKKEVIVGGSGAISDNTVFPKVFNDAIGTKFKIVSGYKGSGEVLLALERGEVEGYNGWSWSGVKQQRPHWIRDHMINILLQAGLAKHEDLPDVPLAIDLAKDEEGKQMLKLICTPLSMARPFLAPPGLAKDRVKVLRAAFQATMKDPEFLNEAQKLKIDVTPVSGEEIQELISQAFSFPKSVIQRTKSVLGIR